MDRDGGIVWIFDCPFHGPEIGVYCFRAFDGENMARWAKYIVRYELMETEGAEIQSHLVSMRTLSDLGLNPVRAS